MNRLEAFLVAERENMLAALTATVESIKSQLILQSF